MTFFALGAGPIPYLYMPEVLPQEIMGTAQVGARQLGGACLAGFVGCCTRGVPAAGWQAPLGGTLWALGGGVRADMQ